MRLSAARQVRWVVPALMLVIAIGAWGVYRARTSGARLSAEPVRAVKILVETTGFYQVTRTELAQAGLGTDGLDLTRLSLSYRDQSVPYVATADSVLFYGQASENRYSRQRVYVIRPNPASPRMTERAAQPAPPAAPATIQTTLRREENYFYEQRAIDASQTDVWFWRKIDLAGEESILELPFELPTVAPGSAELRLRLYGLTHDPNLNGDHDFDVALNGQFLAGVTWDGQIHYTASLPVPDGLLQSGGNTLTIDNSRPGAAFVDQMDLDWFEIDYPAPATAVQDYLQVTGFNGAITLDGFSQTPRLFDVSQPDQPVALIAQTADDDSASLNLTPDTKLIAVGPGGWRSPAGIAPLRQTDLRRSERQADLLIVTTAALAPALEPLIEARQAQGLSVALVDIADIYAEFGYGEVTPEAVQAFVAYAYQKWDTPHPRYLFLVGEATTDPRGYLADAPDNPVAQPQNLVLSPFVSVEFAGETVSDARLADVDGDLRPDLAVGRWPVDDARTVKELVERTLAYEAGQPATKAIFAYDGTSAEFADFTQQLLNQAQFPESERDILAGPSANTVSDHWNAGAWIISYVGHGSQELWGKDEVFSVDSVKQINSAGPPPIVLQFTCLSGQFADPYIQSLSEALLTHPNGPVLLVAATSLTLSTQQSPFAINLLRQLEDTSVQRIGDAFQNAKASLDTANSGLQEISDTFGLLGDPSAQVIRPNPPQSTSP